MIKILLTCLVFNQADSLPPVRIGLVLSGGGALGLAHIGALKVLDEEGIPISALSGNSMGAVVGGLYAAGYTGTQLDSMAHAIDWERLFDDRLPYDVLSLEEKETENRYLLTLPHRSLKPILPSGVLQLQSIEILLKSLLAETEYNTSYNFDSLPIPFRAVAVDLETGEKTVFRTGCLSKAIRASISIPLIFTPTEIDNRFYVDGGLVQDLPVEPIKELKPDFIIAVDLSRREINPRSPIDIIIRTTTIATEKDRREQRALADIVIYPRLHDFLHSDFIKARELIKRGEEAARQALPEIKRLLAGRALANPKRIIKPKPSPFVRTINITGLRTTKEGLVRREIRTRAQSPLDFNKMVSDLERIYHTGLFSHVDCSLDFPSPDSVDLTFYCEERIFGTYALGGRFDNIYGTQLSLEVAENNLFGSRLKASLGATLLYPLTGWLGISGTRLFWFPLNYRLLGYFRETKHSYYANGKWRGDYTDKVQGVELKPGFNLGNNGYFKFGLDLRQVLYEFPDSILSKRNSERLITPEAEIKFNSHRSLVFPFEGSFFSTELKYSSKRLSSDTDFLKLELNAKTGIKILNWLSVEPKIGAGISYGDLPLIEKFKTGSPDFIGYKYEEFLTDRKLTTGITVRTLLFYLFGRRHYPLFLELYGDAATFLPFQNLLLVEQVRGSLSWGTGIGFRTNTLVGPLHLKFGLNGSSGKSVYVSLGHNL